jgi:molybdate transport system substrate-binding protein
VLPILATDFEKQTGHQLTISYAASGTLTTQIFHGAPFEIFLSADPKYIQRLYDAELTQGRAIDYAKAQLTLFASYNSSLDIERGLLGLKTTLEHNKLNKVAIANPRHAPYGEAAQRELEKVGIWKQIQPYLLIAENASQAVQFSLISSVDAGFVPYGHIIQTSLVTKGRFVILDETLQQQAVLVKGASNTAKQFMQYIQSQQAKTILLKYGFL